MKTEYKNMSNRVKLLLNREEGYDVDWKRELKGLKTEDIVAFANSENGGSVLIGVDEDEDADGRQKAVIVGCKCSDSNKQSIISKALHCVPPVEIEIIRENTNKKPFYRVEIPSGVNKSYCTLEGIYKTRDDGRNKAILPNDLLSLFMKLEGGKFLKRFKDASEDIENNLIVVSKDIDVALSSLDEIIPRLENLEEYSYMSDEILGTVNEIGKDVGDASYHAYHNERRILTLLNHLNLEDPFLTDLKKSIKDFIRRDFENGNNINSKDYLKRLTSFFPKLPREELDICYNESVNELKNKK